MGFKSGKDGRATFGGATIKITRWRCRYYTKLHDTTNWDGAGASEFRGCGVIYGDLEIDFNWDFTVFPFGSTIITPGSSATVVLYGDKTDALTVFSGTMIYEDMDIGPEVRGIAKGTLRGKYTGTITKPTR